MEREYPSRPILGVGAIIFHDGKVLLVKRRKEPGYGKWSIPGGAIELGETLKEGVLREVKEETGLEVEIGGMVEVPDWISRDKKDRIKYHYVLVDYWCKCLFLKPYPSSDVLDARWVQLSEAPNYDLPWAALEVINKAFSNYKTSLLK